MNNKKLTDTEIKRALEYCKDCSANLNVEIIDLITRQQEEIDRLRKEVNLVSIQFQDLQERYEEAQTENESLKVENQSLRSAANSLKMHYEEAQTEVERLKESLNIELENFATEYDNKIKAEAYKEFAERLNDRIINFPSVYPVENATLAFLNGSSHRQLEILEIIDNLLKEMTEVNENE